MEKNQIITVCGSQIMHMAYELCERADLAGMIRSLHEKKDPLIALKPNLVGAIPASEGATTHPQILEGVISYLRGRGYRNLVVMEGSWVGDRTQDALAVTGLGDLMRKLDVPFVDLKSDRSSSVNCSGMTLKICQKALDADFLINLPVMKGHCQTGMTCALKNLKGCIPDSEKRRFHRMGLHEPIGHLSSGLKQGFILADAVCPDLTFEDGGNPVPLNRLMCAVDPVLLDTYACYVMGLEEATVPYIRIAETCGAGVRDLAGAEVTALLERTVDGKALYQESGEEAGRWAADYRRILKVKEQVIDVDSCSACYGTLIPVLRRLQEEHLLDHLPAKLCIGQGFRGKKGELGIGNCTSGFRRSAAGCPPTAEEMEQFLRQVISAGETFAPAGGE